MSITLRSVWTGSRMWLACVLSIWIGLTAATPSLANQRLTVTDDVPQQIVLSGRDLNVLMFSGPVVSAITSKADLEAKSEGRNVIVRARSGPADLVVVAAGQTYVFVVGVQAGMGSQVIVIDDVRTALGDHDSDPIRHATDYEDGLLEAINLVARGTTPKGYMVNVLPQHQYPKWLELKVVTAVEYRGPKYRVTVFVLENVTQSKYTLREPEFYTGRQKAISLDRQVIEGGETVQVYIVDDSPPVHEKPAAIIDPDSKN